MEINVLYLEMASSYFSQTFSYDLSTDELLMSSICLNLLASTVENAFDNLP